VRATVHPLAMRSDPNLLSARLDHEWRSLRRRPSAIARARTWGVTAATFADLDDLLVLAGYAGERTPDHNEVLRRLLAIATGDDLAARVVLQRIVPGLLAAVRGGRRAHDGAFEELVGAAWLSIRSGRIETGSDHLAANIVRDAAYRAFTAPRRRRSASEIAVDPHTLDETPAVTYIGACEELAMLLADARADGVPARDLDLVRDLVVVGSPGRLAALRKVTPRTLRNHRDRAAARLRRVALRAA
jgi:hypothetical protein